MAGQGQGLEREGAEDDDEESQGSEVLSKGWCVAVRHEHEQGANTLLGDARQETTEETWDLEWGRRE